MLGLGEENGSEVECYVGSQAFILLARGICWGGGGRAAEPPLLKKFTDAYMSLHLNSFHASICSRGTHEKGWGSLCHLLQTPPLPTASLGNLDDCPGGPLLRGLN